jgi:uncharacterized protein YciI
MQFIVVAYDGKDENALKRRLAAREAHLKSAKSNFESGKWLYASAILDDNEKMIGSAIICDYESRDELQSQWLNNEPYIKGDVWKDIDIKRAQVAQFCLAMK